jgi:dienelactone hydrolase
VWLGTLLSIAQDVALSGTASKLAAGLEGEWQGTLDAGGTKLRLVLKVTKSAEGKLTGTLDSLDQNAKGIPISSIEQSSDQVRLDLAAIGGSYAGKMSVGAVEITGEWKQGGGSLPLVFKRNALASPIASPAPTAIWAPPVYANTDSFHEREVTVGSTPWQLPGMLTLPNGPGPFPAVVLVHGSGAHDRDETIGPNKTFKDLAWGLAGQGIAVLRYDKRTLVHGSEMVQVANLTVKEETVDDAQAAVDLLAAQREIQAKHVFVVGHSLGGYVGPRIAAGDAKVAGLILLAGNSRPMEELLVEQVRHQVELHGRITPEGQAQIDQAEKEEAAIRNPDLKPGVTVKLFGVPIPSSYFLDLRNYRPAEMAATLHIPILVLQGERDNNVRMADFDGWKKSLGNQPTATFKSYPALNHLFVPASGPADSPGLHHVSEEVIQDIASWVKKNSQ